jgi:hypothetical protein
MANKYAGRNKYWTLAMKPDEARRIALGAARATMRLHGIDPSTQSAEDAFCVLDDMLRIAPDLVAAKWHEQSSPTQWKKFTRDWNKWLKTEGQDLS